MDDVVDFYLYRIFCTEFAMFGLYTEISVCCTSFKIMLHDTSGIMTHVSMVLSQVMYDVTCRRS